MRERVIVSDGRYQRFLLIPITNTLVPSTGGIDTNTEFELFMPYQRVTTT